LQREIERAAADAAREERERDRVERERRRDTKTNVLSALTLAAAVAAIVVPLLTFGPAPPKQAPSETLPQPAARSSR
jgi:hypothetical protein